MRHPRHDEDVAMPYARRARHTVGDQFRPFRHPRHPQPRFGQPAPFFIIACEHGARFGVVNHGHPQRHSNRINGYVIMRGADATCGEEIIVARAKRVDGLNNRVLNIRHHPHFAQTNALHIEPQRNLRDILILRPARQDFIANHDQGGGVDAGVCHHGRIANLPRLRKHVRWGALAPLRAAASPRR